MNGRERRMWKRMVLFTGIVLEHTPEGFDLCFCDSATGGSAYSATISFPRLERK